MKNDQEQAVELDAMHRRGASLEELSELTGLPADEIQRRIAGVAPAGRWARRDKGITPAEYIALRELGKRLMAGGMSRERTPLGAFLSQRGNAKKRGIEWKLTLGEWWKIWRDSGKWEERGRTRFGYCMSRRGDRGAYEVGNVYITTLSQNAADTHQRNS